MSNVAPVTSVETAQKGRPLQLAEAVIAGRLGLVRRTQNGFVHLIVLPAADQYSMPSTVEFLSKQRLGSMDDEVRVRVRITGYRRTYESRDKETGEITKVVTADNRLHAVEE